MLKHHLYPVFYLPFLVSIIGSDVAYFLMLLGPKENIIEYLNI